MSNRFNTDSFDTTSFDAESFLAGVTALPGVYQMLDGQKSILYVGKAKNLKKRLSSYFRTTGLGSKTVVMVSKIRHIEITVTHSETEALLLEQNLIKIQHPPYNVLLRDDKSYPYIFLSADEDYPRLSFHRGTKKKRGKYFGPYPNSGAVRESLNFLEKIFRVRQCEDSFFSNRSRPCLQYQIKRCSGPCVNLISPQDYARDVEYTRLFLEGKTNHVTAELADRMEQAATALDFEQAADLRDRIASLRAVQESQSVEVGDANIDVFACALQAGMACVQVIYIRHGRILGSRSYFPNFTLEEQPGELLAGFVPQFYLGGTQHEVPHEVLLAHTPAEEDLVLLGKALSQQAGRQVRVATNVRSIRYRWLKIATNTARENLQARVADRLHIYQRFAALQTILKLDAPPARIECFDISHSSGEATVASCVVFDEHGPVKADYRRFNIDDIEPGDDYAAMQQALLRRYRRLKDSEAKLPDILLIDGGKGQVTQALTVLQELQLPSVLVVGVAKGTTRKAGFETLYAGDDKTGLVLGSDNPALHLIQQIRDEAHRFAITGHKMRRDRKRRTSTMEDIPGIGPARRRELLRFFGGKQEIERAGIADLARVPGISTQLAQEIYDHFHPA